MKKEKYGQSVLMQKMSGMNRITINWDKVWQLMSIIVEISKALETKKLKPGKRKNPSKKTKRIVLQQQNYRCRDCGDYLHFPEFHHKDGNRSNNALWNCQALCPNCHARKTRRK